MAEGISIIIPTLNGGEIFKKCLEAIKAQPGGRYPQLLVIDSGSSDGTLEAAERAGARILQIKQNDFHHSRTRNEALQYAVHDKVVFLTQDAIPDSADWLEIMAGSLERDDAAAVYGRHLPHDDADLFAWFETMSHNDFLGERVLIQTLDAKDSLFRMPYDRADRLTRCDNVCAIYKRDQLARVPFPDVIFGEDMAWAKAALFRGLKIKYDPEIRVKHSHNRSPDYRFRRALIANIVSAEILGRVRQDLSFLTFRDLVRAEEILKAKQERLAGRAAKNKDYEQIAPAPLFSILSRMPRALNALTLMFDRLAVTGGRRQWLFTFPRVVDAKIGFVLNTVTKAFPRSTNQELLSCVEQMIGSIKGILYGSVAASYQLKGALPPQLGDTIRPFFGGL